MSVKKFKKYVIVAPETFEKIKSASFESVSDKLTDTEKSMLNILKDEKLSPSQRLRFYHQLLFQNIKKNQMQNQQLLKPENKPQPNIKPTQSDANTQTRYVLKKNLGTNTDLEDNSALIQHELVETPVIQIP